MPDDASDWKECYQNVQLLSPRAAKLAARMLSKDPLVRSNWVFSLDLALTSRASGAGPLTQKDLEVIAGSQGTDPSGTSDQLDDDQRQALEFSASIRASSVEVGRPAKELQRNTNPDDFPTSIGNAAAPALEEKWLLAFSDEFQRLADGRVDADNLAMCAIERFETDGHRNPVAVAREQFIAGGDGSLSDASTFAARASAG